MSTPDFRVKGSTVTVVVLEIYRYVPQQFPARLAERIEQAPTLFLGSPVVLSFESFNREPDSVPDLQALLNQCRAAGLRPIAFRGLPPDLVEMAALTDLALLPAAAPPSRRSAGAAAERQPNEPATDIALHREPPGASANRPTRTLTRPVRSGQQVYAEGGDLIVLAQVSEGAEVLADGNIHIYGALRGRALAGVQGDGGARIFCQQMDAELISVAGRFLLSDAISETVHRKPALVALEGDALSVTPL